MTYHASMTFSAPQAHLVSYPDAGDVIQGTGGLRKVRWTTQGLGKRGGTRVIYTRSLLMRKFAWF